MQSQCVISSAIINYHEPFECKHDSKWMLKLKLTNINYHDRWSGV